MLTTFCRLFLLFLLYFSVDCLAVKHIQQHILSIKRVATNLEQLLRENKNEASFYAAPQTCEQMQELLEAAQSLQRPCQKGRATSL